MMPDTDQGRLYELEDEWIYKVSVLADHVARRVSEVVQRVSGLKLSQWRVIAAVADQPGRTASDVVDITPMDKVIVSRAVRSLVDGGLIRREASKSDGRLSHLHLTPEGEAAYRAIVAELRATGADGRATLPEEQRAVFLALLKQAVTQY